MSAPETTPLMTTAGTSTTQTDFSFVKSPHGVARLAQMLGCVSSFILLTVAVSVLGMLPGTESWILYMQVVTGAGFLQALIYLIVNILMPNIPNYEPNGTFVELILSAVWVILLVIAGIIGFIYSDPSSVVGSVTWLTFFSAASYAFGGIFLFNNWRLAGGTLSTLSTVSIP